MRIRLNGEERELPDGISVANLILQLDLRPEQVAVERNGELMRRGEHAGTRLQDGDVVEVVTLVGGG
ncbi:MAG: sulfur carrier protein ThiS [Planctomycetota bacterium]|nr:sulfur carrier protein ThiS [Planctomycetota bacterium]